MKRITLLALPFLLMTMTAASCPPPNPENPKDPYQTARTTITIMQTTLETGKLMFDGVASGMKIDCTEKLCVKLHPDKTSAAYQACLGADHSAVQEFKQCYKIGAAVPWVEAGVKIGVEGCKTAREAVQLAADLAQARADKKKIEEICLQVDPTKGDQYQLCIAGKPVAKADYTAVLKKSACLAYESFKLVPADPKYDLYINAVRFWLKSYGGCD